MPAAPPGIDLLPSAAIPLSECRAERHPAQRLHRVCDGAEVVTRFASVIAVALARGRTTHAVLRGSGDTDAIADTTDHPYHALSGGVRTVIRRVRDGVVSAAFPDVYSAAGPGGRT